MSKYFNKKVCVKATRKILYVERIIFNATKDPELVLKLSDGRMYNENDIQIIK